MENVVRELQKAIDLTETEYNIVFGKLSDFSILLYNILVFKIKNNKTLNKYEQKNSLEGGGSTTPDADIFSRKKKTYENFIISYNKLIHKIDNLINHDNTQKLEEIVYTYFNYF
jgi:hypothetical protein